MHAKISVETMKASVFKSSVKNTKLHAKLNTTPISHKTSEAVLIGFLSPSADALSMRYMLVPVRKYKTGHTIANVRSGGVRGGRV